MEGKKFSMLLKVEYLEKESKEKKKQVILDCGDCVARVAKVSNHKQFKILNCKQILQRLPIVFAQVKGDNLSENFTNYIFFAPSKINH